MVEATVRGCGLQVKTQGMRVLRGMSHKTCIQQDGQSQDSIWARKHSLGYDDRVSRQKRSSRHRLQEVLASPIVHRHLAGNLTFSERRIQSRNKDLLSDAFWSRRDPYDCQRLTGHPLRPWCHGSLGWPSRHERYMPHGYRLVGQTNRGL